MDQSETLSNATNDELLNPVLDLPPDPMDFAIGMDEEEEAAAAEEEEAAVVEQVAEAAPVSEAAPEPTPDLSSKFAEIAAKEAALLAEKQALATGQAEVADLAEIRELWKKGDHLDALAKMGITYNQITQDFIEGKGPSPEDSLRQAMAEQKAEFDAQIESLRAPQRAAQEQSERTRVAEALAADDNFPLLQATSGADRIFDRVKKHYGDTGQILSYVEAAVAVENELKTVVDALRASPNAASIFGTANPEATATPVQTPLESSGNEPVGSVTLSNDIAAVKSVVVEDGFDPDTASDEEMISRLAEQLRFI